VARNHTCITIVISLEAISFRGNCGYGEKLHVYYYLITLEAIPCRREGIAKVTSSTLNTWAGHHFSGNEFSNWREWASPYRGWC